MAIAMASPGFEGESVATVVLEPFNHRSLTFHPSCKSRGKERILVLEDFLWKMWRMGFCMNLLVSISSQLPSHGRDSWIQRWRSCCNRMVIHSPQLALWLHPVKHRVWDEGRNWGYFTEVLLLLLLPVYRIWGWGWGSAWKRRQKT